MAISPGQAIAERIANIASETKAYEATIDAFLKKNFEEGKSLVYNSQRIPNSIRDELVNRYRAAGWRVEIFFDRPGGDYLKFSQPKP